jgi:formate hydrogenlyase subunit 3/multisubunit Na+/H+ antiporter MnhD subunit
VVTVTSLLFLAAAWPLVLLAALAVPPLRHAAVRLSPTLAIPALVLAFAGDSALEVSAPGVFTSMRLGVDMTGRPFLMLTALLWTLCGWHAAAYMRDDPRRVSFTGLMAATGAGNIGLVLAQDALSFYLFFALMTFAGYGLVVHSRTPAALRAGRVYIIMAVAGEAMILAGLFQLIGMAGDATFRAVPDAFSAMPAPGAAAALLLAGFGVKAGLMPLHLWLPLAHPVAPTPASALLSGAMIKAGVLGWLRFLPLGAAAFPTLGLALMLTGVSATLLAAGIGVTQRDVKTVLAYSSISQMGFLAVGVGAALLVPAAAPMLVLAVAVYAVHHAVAKAALFLGVSVVAGPRPRSLLVLAGIPGLVLAGAPLSSGAIAKSALKNALGDVPPPAAVPVDALLSLAAVGTTLLMARYLSLLALPPQPGTVHAHHREAGILVPWVLLVAASAMAAIWLPWFLAPLGELPLATSPAYIAAAAWPLVLGAGIAVGGALLYRRYPALTIRSVPAGDIVAILESVAAAAMRVLEPLTHADPGVAVRKWWAGLGRSAGDAVDRAAAAYDEMAAGPVLGALFVIVAVLLFTALR